MQKSAVKYLKLFLYLVSLHSFFVGLGLILIPAHIFVDFGYNQIGENFFKAQGGVFHLVMVVAYLSAAIDPAKNKMMVIFSIIAKLIATLFLFSYYFIFDTIIVVLLSGVADFGMGTIIYLLTKASGLFDERK